MADTSNYPRITDGKRIKDTPTASTNIYIRDSYRKTDLLEYENIPHMHALSYNDCSIRVY